VNAAAHGRAHAQVNGVLILDKPPGMTSFSIVASVRKMLQIKKVGHCGTLDPFATGVLVVCINQATRIVDQLLSQDKVYRFTMHLGVETDTLDSTGQVVRTHACPEHLTKDLEDALQPFRGRYLQQVPRYAAVKVRGRRLYDWTRKGIEVTPPTREAHIYRLDILDRRWPEVILEVHCSKGTYVRQLAADIGKTLGIGAHVSKLRRLASGRFHLGRAVSLNELGEAKERGNWPGLLISMNEALADLPAVLIEEEAAGRLRNGYLDAQWKAVHSGTFSDRGGPVRLVTSDGLLLALWWPEACTEAGGAEHSRSIRVFV